MPLRFYADSPISQPTAYRGVLKVFVAQLADSEHIDTKRIAQLDFILQCIEVRRILAVDQTEKLVVRRCQHL